MSKSKIRIFSVEYSRHLNLESLATQTACEQILNRAITSHDNGVVALARAEYASVLVKKDEALVVRTRLKISSEARGIECRGS